MTSKKGNKKTKSRKEDYILLTPIGEAKQYSLQEFFSNVLKFKHKPKEIAVCVRPNTSVEGYRPSIEKKGIKLTVIVLGDEQEIPENAIGLLGYITASRELLRKYFLKTNYTWALWLDSDIIPEIDCFDKLFKIAKAKKVIAVSSSYPGGDDNLWNGGGIMLTHKISCHVSRFMVGNVPVKKNELMNLSEDLMFFALIDAPSINAFVKLWTGLSGRAVGKFISVKHILNPGEEKEINL